jgi:LPS-assembly protein
MRSVRRKFVPLCAALLFLLLSPGISSAADNGELQLDAESISYEESTGIAVAEGSARVTDGDLWVTAPRMEYYSMSQSVTAFASPAERVVLFTEGKRVEGDRLDYDLAARRGTMIRPDGKVDLYYVKGSKVDVMPKPEIPARRRASVSDGSAGQDDDLAALWKDAVCSTCGLSHPHYRLQARSVTVYPGDKMVLHGARVYIGRFLAMASPFDITISLNDRSDQKIFPRLGYDSDKGVGLGIQSGVGWRGGSLALDFIGWSEGIFEMDALAVHQITAGLSVYGGIRREYSKNLEEAEWRPRWGASYAWKGWTLSAGWTRRELLSVERRAGEVFRYELERNPEISLYSPWYKERISGGNFRIFGLWGSYRDRNTRFDISDSYTRTGLGFQITGEPWAKKGFTPFYNAAYTHFMYDDDIFDSQKVLDTRVGVLWKAGNFDFSTAYLRQWVWGRSPLRWDNYAERDELYQEIGFLVPTKNPDYSWKLGMRAAYDIADEELAEMVYKVSYQHHCLVWNAVFRDDVRGDDDWVGLTLSVKDLPNGNLRLFGDSDDNISDPFAH